MDSIQIGNIGKKFGIDVNQSQQTAALGTESKEDNIVLFAAENDSNGIVDTSNIDVSAAAYDDLDDLFGDDIQDKYINTGKLNEGSSSSSETIVDGNTTITIEKEHKVELGEETDVTSGIKVKDPVNPNPVVPDPVDPDPVVPDPVVPDPVDPDPVDPDPVIPDPVDPDPVDPDPVIPDPVDPDPVDPDPVVPDPVNPEVNLPGVIIDGAQDGKPQKSALYLRDDGKYIWSNNGNEEVIEADNIKEAYAKVIKANNGYNGRGYIEISDGENSYSENYGEAAFSDSYSLDKRSKDNKSFLDISSKKMADSTTINASISKGNNVMSYDAGVAVPLSQDDVKTQLDFNTEIKTGKDTEFTNKSFSIGGQVEFHLLDEHTKNTDGQLSFNGQSVVSYLKADNQDYMYLGSEVSAEYVKKFETDTMLTPRVGFGVADQNSTVFYNNSVKNQNRLTFETGGGLEFAPSKTLRFDTALTGGVSLDIESQGSKGEIKPYTSAKLNSKVGVEYNPNEKVTLKGEATGFLSAGKVAQRYGFGAKAAVEYKGENDKAISTGVTVEQEKTHLQIGGLNQDINESLKLGVEAEAQLNKNATIFGNVKYDTKNKNVEGMLGGKFKF